MKGGDLATEEFVPLSSRLTVEGRDLPGWACWLIDLGFWLRARSDRDNPPLIAISVPTRTLAAVLVATGAHDAGVGLADTVTVDQAMDLVGGWGEGAIVGFDFRGKRREGSIVRVDENHIFIQSGPDVCGVPRDRVLNIDLLPDGAAPSVRGRRLPTTASLRSHLYPTDPLNRIGSSRVECLVIGPKGQIEEDLATEVKVGHLAASSLAEIIRPCSLVPAKGPFRTEVVASSAHALPAHLRSRPAKSIVLDGAGATLDWLDRLPGAPVLVILDRTEARAEDAAAVILGRRASERHVSASDRIAEPPSAIEMITYGGQSDG